MRKMTQVRYTDLGELLAPEGGRSQPMQGFDEEFVDIVDYIIRITYRIWEEKGVERIRDYYEPDMRIHTMSGEIVGSEAVVTNTHDTLRAFPDRTLWGDDVIWSGNEQDGFYSSHRIVSNMTNRGDSEMGPATGRHATVITIAVCAVRNNRVYEEWLVRDRLGLALQLGVDLQAAVKAGVPTGEAAAYIERQGAATRAAEGGKVREAPIAKALPRLWLGDISSALREYYRPTVTVNAPGGRLLCGYGELAAFWQYLRELCLEPVFSADHLCETSVALDGKRAVALRWRVSARAANGRPVYILAVTHWQLQDDLVTEEWTVFDELSLMSQVCDV